MFKELPGLKRIGVLLTLLSVSSIALAEADSESDNWSFGIGTSFFALNVEGDVGINTQLGPSVTKLDLDFDDVNNAMDSAAGIAGFAQKGDWKINYALGKLKLEGETGPRRLSFSTSALDVNLEHPLSITGLSIYGGLRYTDHELDFKGPVINRSLDEDWVDVYVGLAYVMAIAPDITWSTRVDIGGGGSDGSATFNTGINWEFSEQWLATFYGKYYTVEYENGSKGDSDWYLYDNDEFGLGLGISYLW